MSDSPASPISGIVNFRDLGGHATPDGPVRTGRVFRSDSLAHVDAADVEHLVEERGVRTVVDLRGATEVDMVVDLGSVLAGDWGAVEADVAAVSAACGPAVLLKVILESAALTPEQLAEACRRSEAGGAQYVKTSTGFHPAGGATVEAVARMRAAVGDRLGVKASGGIRDWATAVAMIDAGASRLGCSATRSILEGAP